MIGQKIIEFENKYNTALDFKNLFRINLEVDDDVEVEILEPIIGCRHAIKVDGVKKVIDLTDNNMVYSRKRKKLVNISELGRMKKVLQ